MKGVRNTSWVWEGAYIVAAALKYFGMKQLGDKPTVHVLPKDIVHESVDKKQQYFNEPFGRFVCTFVLQNSPTLQMNVKITL